MNPKAFKNADGRLKCKAYNDIETYFFILSN